MTNTSFGWWCTKLQLRILHAIVAFPCHLNFHRRWINTSLASICSPFVENHWLFPYWLNDGFVSTHTWNCIWTWAKFAGSWLFKQSYRFFFAAHNCSFQMNDVACENVVYGIEMLCEFEPETVKKKCMKMEVTCYCQLEETSLKKQHSRCSRPHIAFSIRVHYQH